MRDAEWDESFKAWKEKKELRKVQAQRATEDRYKPLPVSNFIKKDFQEVEHFVENEIKDV